MNNLLRTFAEYPVLIGIAFLMPAANAPVKLSKGYAFNLQELKQPIIEAVTASGWTWQPVMWNATKSLRWLAE